MLLDVLGTVCLGIPVVEHQPCLEKRGSPPIPAPAKKDLPQSSRSIKYDLHRHENIWTVKMLIYPNSLEVLYLFAAALWIARSSICLLTVFCPHSSFWANWWAPYFFSLKIITGTSWWSSAYESMLWLPRIRVQSLVGELKSHKPSDSANTYT